jgi:hypothetical protein
MVVDQYGWFSITEARTVFDRLPGLWTEVKGLEHRYPQPSMINLIECLGHFSGPSPTEDDLDRPDDSEVLHRAAGTAAQWAKALGGKHHAEAKVVARQLKELAEGFRLLQEGKLDAETFRGPARGLSI